MTMRTGHGGQRYEVECVEQPTTPYVTARSGSKFKKRAPNARAVGHQVVAPPRRVEVVTSPPLVLQDAPRHERSKRRDLNARQVLDPLSAGVVIAACGDLLLDRVVTDADDSEPRGVVLLRNALNRLVAWRLHHSGSLTATPDVERVVPRSGSCTPCLVLCAAFRGFPVRQWFVSKRVKPRTSANQHVQRERVCRWWQTRLVDRDTARLSGGGGIRTLGRVNPVGGFQDRTDRPLRHPAVARS